MAGQRRGRRGGGQGQLRDQRHELAERDLRWVPLGHRPEGTQLRPTEDPRTRGNYRRVGWNDAAPLFSEGQVDAILAVGGRDLGWLSSIAASQDVKYLSWEDKCRDKIAKNYGVLKVTLVKGVFPKQDMPLKCTQDSGLINTHKGVSEEAVYKFTKGAIAREKQIRQSTGLLKPFEASSAMVEPVPFDLHSGAKKEYTEEGIL